jgi:hypothetical protein
MKEQKDKAPHILSISATLFGFCYVVLTSISALKLNRQSLIDEFTAVSMFLFMGSCLFSFLSIRSKTQRANTYENIADYIFLTGLFTLFATTVFIVFHFMK